MAQVRLNEDGSVECESVAGDDIDGKVVGAPALLPMNGKVRVVMVLKTERGDSVAARLLRNMIMRVLPDDVPWMHDARQVFRDQVPGWLVKPKTLGFRCVPCVSVGADRTDSA